MSKHCAICNSKINFMSEYKLSKDMPNTMICFDCYQYVSTAIKGEQRAIDILKQKYTDATSNKVSDHISMLEKKLQNPSKPKQNSDDMFMNIVGTDSKPEQISSKHKTNHSVVYIDKLTKKKIEKLQTTKIIANLCFFALLLIVPLLSFYIFVATDTPIIGIVFLVCGSFTAILFHCVRQIIDTIYDEQ